MSRHKRKVVNSSVRKFRELLQAAAVRLVGPTCRFAETRACGGKSAWARCQSANHPKGFIVVHRRMLWSMSMTTSTGG